MKYKLVERKNPQNPEAAGKLYASPVNDGRIITSNTSYTSNGGNQVYRRNSWNDIVTGNNSRVTSPTGGSNSAGNTAW
ncbi:hypothetical protein FACS189416_7350 [Bacteroidia bacterium]|nr:hypothetical protein FACS189416_7350 [Bacteroidia bacterium]